MSSTRATSPLKVAALLIGVGDSSWAIGDEDDDGCTATGNICGKAGCTTFVEGEHSGMVSVLTVGDFVSVPSDGPEDRGNPSALPMAGFGPRFVLTRNIAGNSGWQRDAERLINDIRMYGIIANWYDA